MASIFEGVDCKSNACENGERIFSSAVLVSIPSALEIPEVDRGFSECCYQNLVLADENEWDSEWKNDFLGVYHQKQIQNETCSFILRNLADNSETDLINYCTQDYKPFGSIPENLMLSIAVVEWKEVLLQIGEGTFQIVKRINIAGSQYEELSNTYNLKRFTIEIADKSVRIDSNHNGRMLEVGVDFKNSKFRTSQRLMGFFGNRDVSYIQDDEVFSNDEKIEQVSMQRENKYQFQGNKLPDCITEILFDFIFLGNELFLNDYNANNHSYSYKRKPVKLADNSGTKYHSMSRNAQINITFEDRYKLGRNINY